MKTFTSIAIAFFLVLSVVPAMAADQAFDNGPLTFQALSNLPATQLEALTPLTETELASIEGSGGIFVACNFGFACSNSAAVSQSNTITNTSGDTGVVNGGTTPTPALAVGIFSQKQANYSTIIQKISIRVR
jgi:hypothetical protein